MSTEEDLFQSAFVAADEAAREALGAAIDAWVGEHVGIGEHALATIVGWMVNDSMVIRGLEDERVTPEGW